MASEQAGSEPVIIKKYANRRLYNTATSSYVTLDDLAGMVRQSQDFIVYDAKTLEEIKRIPMKKPSGKYNVWNKTRYSEGTSH